jgi:ABC-2 type transport system permease protein
MSTHVEAPVGQVRSSTAASSPPSQATGGFWVFTPQSAAIAERELSAMFFSPIAYAVIAIFLIVAGIFFSWQTFLPGEEASLRTLMDNMPLIFVFVLPMLTMRLMSEEFRSGTVEPLTTAPITDADVILGKFYGGLVFFLVLLATTLPHWVLVGMYGDTDFGGTLASYLGLMLLGAMYLSVGLFFSTCTSNQVIAVLGSFVFLAVFTFLANFLALRLDGTLRVVMQYLSVVTHYQDFARGMVGLTHVFFFLSTTVFFLFLAIKVLESRRWR